MLELKNQFPIYQSHPNLVYLDSAATTQKPQAVISAVLDFYTKYNAPIHRGTYGLSDIATSMYENSRQKVAGFLGAASAEEIVFTKNATESINLIAHGLKKRFAKGDNLILSEVEHHSNLIPWQKLAEELEVEIRYLKMDLAGHIDLENLKTLVDQKTKIISLTHCSNVLGTINPLSEIKKITQKGSPSSLLIVDASQTVPHLTLSVKKINCDLLFFSGHKLYAPSGVGVIWGQKAVLDTLEPLNYGGGMVEDVSPISATFQEAPQKFEGGTPNAEGVIGLSAALDFISSLSFNELSGMKAVEAHISLLHNETLRLLSPLIEQGKIQIIGKPDPRSGIISFYCPKYHPHDLAYLLDKEEICIRAGQHCASPLHQKLNLVASNRISFGVNNNLADVNKLIESLNGIL